jgi:hypothetical protein
MLRLHSLCLLALLSASSAASADDELPLPAFDVRRYCVTMELGSSGSYDSQRCLQDEARSAAAVRANWERLQQDPRITCTRIARDSGQSFFVLEACLRNVAAGTWAEPSALNAMADRGQMISRSFRR